MKLHEQVKLANENHQVIHQELTDLLLYLGSSKFHGTDNNFVNASEMYSRVQKLYRMESYAASGENLSEINFY